MSEWDRANETRRRVELNAAVRSAKIERAAVPHLGNSKLLMAWQRTHQRDANRRIRRAQRDLATIADRIGPPPQFRKFRKRTPADERIERLYKPAVKATPPLPAVQAMYYRDLLAKYADGYERLVSEDYFGWRTR